jgi:FkbM family methyltransferase
MSELRAPGLAIRAWWIFRQRGLRGLLHAIARRGLRYTRFIRRVSKRELLQGRRVFSVRGLELEVPPDMAWAFRDGSYHEHNVEFWLERILRSREGSVFYDVGSNCGYYTVGMAPLAKRVYAFEPAPQVREVLERNIRRNGIENVTVFPCALGEKRDSAQLTLYSVSANNTLLGRCADIVGDLPIEGRTRVDVIPLDELVGAGDVLPPDAMKIDAEGSEIFILRGAREVLAEYRPTVVMEYDERHARNAGHSLADLRDELGQHEYLLYGLSDPMFADGHDKTLRQLDDESATIGTLVALPSSLAERLVPAPS